MLDRKFLKAETIFDRLRMGEMVIFAKHGDPEGGAHGCAPFFDGAMDGESKNPLSDETSLTL